MASSQRPVFVPTNLKPAPKPHSDLQDPLMSPYLTETMQSNHCPPMGGREPLGFGLALAATPCFSDARRHVGKRRPCIFLRRFGLVLTFGLVLVITAHAATSPAPVLSLRTAITLADTGADSGLKEELQQEICFELIRRGEFAAAQSRAPKLPAYRHAAVLLELSARLPANQRAEAEKLLATAQHDLELTLDWHKSRVSRVLAVAQAKLGQHQTAAKTARDVPDAEDRAFALRDVVHEFCRQGEVSKARELADAIEENRRYGTYRQKAGALAAIARALHVKGDQAEADALLTHAASLLPKKPGWSDGGALLEVAQARFDCGQAEAGRELLVRAEVLARGIAGAWRVSELCAVATAWQSCGERDRAQAVLKEAQQAIATFPAPERGPESLALARAQHAAGNVKDARLLVSAALIDATGAGDADVWRAQQVRALLVWAELFGEEAVPELKQ